MWKPARSERQAVELRQFLFALPPGETVIVVTHDANVRALADRRGIASGGVIPLEIGRDRTLPVVNESFVGPER